MDNFTGIYSYLFFTDKHLYTYLLHTYTVIVQKRFSVLKTVFVIRFIGNISGSWSMCIKQFRYLFSEVKKKYLLI